jgi:hypothetical protein
VVGIGTRFHHQDLLAELEALRKLGRMTDQNDLRIGVEDLWAEEERRVSRFRSSGRIK